MGNETRFEEKKVNFTKVYAVFLKKTLNIVYNQQIEK